MRRHGWQLPYHPLQVVAIALFLALAFAFYVFFVPFVGRKRFQYVVLGIYTPMVTCVFCLYIWCIATDPADPGVFKSKKYLKVKDAGMKALSGQSVRSSATMQNAAADENNPQVKGSKRDSAAKELSNVLNIDKTSSSSFITDVLKVLIGWYTCLHRAHHPHDQSQQQMSDDGMFYCSLCEVEVLKNSKHCRVCDKCVDSFDHHCRWLNNCIGRRNYLRFFILMICALLLVPSFCIMGLSLQLILQWSIGILVLIRCFLQRKHFSAEIVSKLGSSFSLVPFAVVVAACTTLAMIAAFPLAQLFFFHVLLIQKGISTYDYIIALREQEQQDNGGPHSPQMSQMSSFTGLSSTSSFNTFHRGAWCTPPRLFLEDQFDVIPLECATSITAKKYTAEPTKQTTASAVKISPWTLARMNAEEVSKASAQARQRSKIRKPIAKGEMFMGQEIGSRVAAVAGVRGHDGRKQSNERSKPPLNLPPESLTRISVSGTDSNASELTAEASTSLAPLQLEARSAFRTSRAMSSSGVVASSPDSSLSSPDLHIHPFRMSTGGEESVGLVPLPSGGGSSAQKSMLLSRSNSDGYDASGGEDSDRIPSKIVYRSTNWSNLLLKPDNSSDVLRRPKESSLSVLQAKNRNLR